jgi:hypothetical protein
MATARSTPGTEAAVAPLSMCGGGGVMNGVVVGVSPRVTDCVGVAVTVWPLEADGVLVKEIVGDDDAVLRGSGGSENRGPTLASYLSNKRLLVTVHPPFAP